MIRPRLPESELGTITIATAATRTRLISVLHQEQAQFSRSNGTGITRRGRSVKATVREVPQLPERPYSPFRREDPMAPTLAELAKMFDHSLLQPPLTDADLERGLEVAIEYNVASVCIKPYAVRRAAKVLAGTTIATSTVIGFPHGGHLTAVKVFEAEQAIADGAVELDMVVNIGKVLSADWKYVADDIRAVVDLAHGAGAKVKVIFENAFLKDEHKRELCRICGEVRADWVKTSTGYAETGATLEDLKLMREASPPWVQVKAAGGVRTFERLMEVRALGVTRVGATATKQILDEAKAKLGG